MKKFMMLMTVWMSLGMATTASAITEGGCTENPFERELRR